MIFAEDFALTRTGTASLAGLDKNIVARLAASGDVEIVARDFSSATSIGATAAAFGRTTQDQDVLYITTGGGEAAPIYGTHTEGDKIVALTI